MVGVLVYEEELACDESLDLYCLLTKININTEEVKIIITKDHIFGQLCNIFERRETNEHAILTYWPATRR